MAWARSRPVLALVLVFAIAPLARGDPQRAPDRPPAVLAIPLSHEPTPEELASAPDYPLGDATFRFAYTSTTLYVVAEVVDADLIAQVDGDDDPAASGEDAVEVLLDADLDSPTTDAVTHLVASAAGGLYDARGAGDGEDAGLDVATATVEIDGGGWRATIALDADTASVRAEGGQVIAFDFAIHDLDGGGGAVVTDDWSGLDDLTARPCWSRLQLLGAGDPQTCIGGYAKDGDACLTSGAAGCRVTPAGRHGSPGWLAAALGLGLGLGLGTTRGG